MMNSIQFALRITHLPTGVHSVYTSVSRPPLSAHKAKVQVMRVLRAKVAAVHRGEWTPCREYALDLQEGELSPTGGWKVVREYALGDEISGNPLLQSPMIKSPDGEVLVRGDQVQDVLDGALELLAPKPKK